MLGRSISRGAIVFFSHGARAERDSHVARQAILKRIRTRDETSHVFAARRA